MTPIMGILRGQLLLAALICSSLLAMASITAYADGTTYVLISNGPSCNVNIVNVKITSFKLILPSDDIAKLVGSKSLIEVHVCECLLMSGDPAKCAINEIRKSARRIDFGQLGNDALDHKAYMQIENSDEFAKLYSSLFAKFANQPTPVQQILNNLGGGGGKQGNPPPDIHIPGSDHPHKAEHRECELEPEVCVKPGSEGVSANFELKCEGLPAFVFSTNGKAGIKVGPLEISLSAGQ